MTKSQFSRLKLGDVVTLAVSRPDYSCGHATVDGRVYVPAGTQGVIGAVKVPSVRGREGSWFHCVDFSEWPIFRDRNGSVAVSWHRTDLPCRVRVAVDATDLI